MHKPPRHWRQWALGTTLLYAALWGLLSLVLHAPGPAQAEVLLHVALVAVAMGSAVHLAGLYRLLVLYVVLVLGPLALRDAAIGGTFYGFLALLSTMIGLYALINGRYQATMFQEILAQRRRNDQLVEALRLENQRTEAALQAAEQANAARGRFFAAANHDLRQPLHALGLLAQTLHAHAAQVNVREVSGHLVECVDGMTHVVDELLDISRQEAGHMTVHKEPFALHEMLQEVERTYRPLAQDKGLQLTIAAAPTCVDSDRTLLARIVSNLVSNAIRYSERGEIRISVHVGAADVEVAVEDDGIGIAREELPRIFEAFYQAGNPARDRRLGLGLGLATVKRLCDLLGLAVSVQSTPGQAAALPCACCARAAHEPHRQRGGTGTGGRPAAGAARAGDRGRRRFAAGLARSAAGLGLRCTRGGGRRGCARAGGHRLCRRSRAGRPAPGRRQQWCRGHRGLARHPRPRPASAGAHR